jgi:hypothetical protein
MKVCEMSPERTNSHPLNVGDGEPDEDFPALDRHRTLKQFGNVSECCLCVKKGAATPPPVPAASQTPTANKDPISVSPIID